MFKILDKACKPHRGSKYSACVDLRSREDITIGAGETVKIPLGVCIDLEQLRKNAIADHIDVIGEGWEYYLKSRYLQLMPRSSLGAKGLDGKLGVIDLDYKNEIMLIVHNPVQLHRFVQNCENRTVLAFDDDVEFAIKKGDRVGQIALLKHESYLFEIDSKEERIGGFGSTGNE